jgi:hypothetical protein
MAAEVCAHRLAKGKCEMHKGKCRQVVEGKVNRLRADKKGDENGD